MNFSKKPGLVIQKMIHTLPMAKFSGKPGTLSTLCSFAFFARAFGFGFGQRHTLDNYIDIS
jgi:hypothetical protein